MEQEPRQRSDSMETDKGFPQDQMLVNLDTHLKNEEARGREAELSELQNRGSFDSPSKIEVNYQALHNQSFYRSVLPDEPVNSHLPDRDYEETKLVVDPDDHLARVTEIPADLVSTSKARRVGRNASRSRTSMYQLSEDEGNRRRSKRLESRHKALQMQLTYSNIDDELNDAQQQ